LKAVRVVLVWLVVTSWLVGCSPTLKRVRFEFEHGGTTISADKDFNDGFGLAPSSVAWAAVERGDYEGGIETLLQVAEDNPDDPWVHYNIAVLYEALGRWDMAESFARDAMEIEAKLAEKEGRTPIGKFRQELRYIERYR
jgi:tetratricopeptide (TPR) repeat protein